MTDRQKRNKWEREIFSPCLAFLGQSARKRWRNKWVPADRGREAEIIKRRQIGSKKEQSV